jgi:hypothetical protein
MMLCYPPDTLKESTPSRASSQVAALFQSSSRNREYFDGFPHDEVKYFLDTYFPDNEDFRKFFIYSAEWLYQEYRKLDKQNTLRRDGSTHWSHAWETTQLLVELF